MERINTKEAPVVSVIVLTYNQAYTVGRTIDSILAQKTDFPFEIIIGEDASPNDGTRIICESYVQKYPDIILLMPKAPNKGLLRNYIDCVAAAKGKYIAACAGDDWWSNDEKLQRQVEFLENNHKFGVCYGGAICYNVASSRSFYQAPQAANNDDLLGQLLQGNFIVASSVLYRRELLGKFDFEEIIELGFRMEDYPMWISMSRYTKFQAIYEPLVTYTVNENSLSRFDDIDKQIDFENTILRIKLFYWAKYRSVLNVEKILDLHFLSLFYLLLKTSKHRKRAKYFLQQVGKLTNKQRLAYFATCSELSYVLFSKVYNKTHGNG